MEAGSPGHTGPPRWWVNILSALLHVLLTNLRQVTPLSPQRGRWPHSSTIHQVTEAGGSPAVQGTPHLLSLQVRIQHPCPALTSARSFLPMPRLPSSWSWSLRLSVLQGQAVQTPCPSRRSSHHRQLQTHSGGPRGGVLSSSHPPPVLGSPSQLRTVSSLQSLSHVRLFATPLAAPRQASLSITNSRSLLKLRSSESVMPSNHLILC